MAQIDLNDVIASELTAQGLLTALTDLQDDTNTQLVKVKGNPNSVSAVNSLATQVEHSFDAINAIIDCLQKLNDANISNLNIIADNLLSKDGDK